MRLHYWIRLALFVLGTVLIAGLLKLLDIHPLFSTLIGGLWGFGNAVAGFRITEWRYGREVKGRQ